METIEYDKPIEKALEDWGAEITGINTLLGCCELLAGLAEEAAELAQAALKLRRTLDGRNPTPVSTGDASRKLNEEFADVLLCAVQKSAPQPHLHAVLAPPCRSFSPTFTH